MRRLIKPRHKVCNAWNEMPVDHQGRIPSDSPADWHTASSSISRRDHRLKSLLKLLMFATARLTHGLLLSTALKTDLQLFCTCRLTPFSTPGSLLSPPLFSDSAPSMEKP